MGGGVPEPQFGYHNPTQFHAVCVYENLYDRGDVGRAETARTVNISSDSGTPTRAWLHHHHQHHHHHHHRHFIITEPISPKRL